MDSFYERLKSGRTISCTAHDSILGGKNPCAIVEQLYAQIQALQEQLKNAIVPKFKIGQEVFFIIDRIEKGKIEKVIFTLSKLEEETFTFYSITDTNGYALRLPEEQIFTTQAEAEQGLKELQGDK